MPGYDGYRVMSNELDPKPEPPQLIIYQIRIKGHLGREWTDWFEGLAITLEDNGETLLTGPVVDQAALHGLLRKVRDRAMPLLLVNRITPGQAEASDGNATYCSRSNKEEKNEDNEQGHRKER